MALFKNVSSQKVAVFAYDTANDTPKTGDAANITAQISKDGGATAASNDTNPTELDATNAAGIYLFDLTQAESNCDLFILNADSSTADISIEPVIVYTLPGSSAGVTPEAAGVRTAVGLASANLDTQLGDVPTVSEMNARTLAAADYFDPAADTVANVTTVATVTNPVTAGTVSDKTGYSLSAAGAQAIWDALTSALTTVGSIGKLLVDRIDAAITSRMATFSYTAPPTAAALADQVWDEMLSGHLSAGSTGAALDDAGGGGGASAADVWAYGTRSLTTAAVVGPNSGIDGEDITAHRGDSLSVSFTGLGSVAARTKLWFTAKRRASEDDDDAQVQIIEGTGLTYIAGSTAATAGNGSLTVTDENDGDVTLALDEVETAKMPADRTLVWDIQMRTASTVTTLAAGTLTFTADVTRATS